MTDGHQRQQWPLRAAVGSQERPVVPTGALRRTSRRAVLPLRHAARTAAAASRLSRAATDQVASRTAEQVFTTLGELRGRGSEAGSGDVGIRGGAAGGGRGAISVRAAAADERGAGHACRGRPPGGRR